MSETTIFDAVKAGDVERVRELLAADPELTQARDEAGLSPLIVALYHRQAGVRDAILATDPELDVFAAGALDRTDRVTALLDADPALLETRSPDGFTPLQFAAFFGGAACVAALLERGAATTTASENPLGVHALNAAAAGGDVETVRVLLEAGADVGARMTGGHTALHSAAANGRPELVELLLAHGAPRDAVNDDGKSAADLAQEHAHGTLAARLRD